MPKRLVFGITYHGSTGEALQGLDNVYGKHISAARLEAQLAWIARRFQVLTLEEILTGQYRGSGFRNVAFIAFHDGYRGNYEVAFPLLQKYGLKADFFVPTDFIGSSRRFWVDRLDAALKYSQKASVDLELAGQKHSLGLQSQELRLQAAEQLRRSLKQLAEHAFQAKFTKVLTELGWEDEATLPHLGTHEAFLDWEQLRTMSAAGMGIGSHTHRHVILAQQEEAVARAEMTTSKARLEEELQRPCHILCYPNGSYPFSGDEKTDRWARETGYQGVLYMTSAYNLVHESTFRFTGAAFGEFTELDKVQMALSRLRFHLRRLRGDRLWHWKSDAISG